MRRTPPSTAASQPLAVPVPLLVLVTCLTLLVAGCGGEEATPDADASTAPATSSAAGSTPTTDAPSDTFADVEERATVPVAADVVPGIDALSVWKGADVEDREEPIGAELFLSPGRSVTLVANSFDGLSARPTSEAELRYFRRNSAFVDGSVTVMEPVVVDGLEMLHARGEGPLGTVDWFVHAFGDLTVEVLFTMPADLSEEQRETYVAQVMATLELDGR